MNARRKWVICPACGGEGEVDALGVVNRDDFTEEEWQDYRAGALDCPCTVCNGRGSVADFDPGALVVRSGSDGQNVFYADADDASEHFLRMAEGLA